MTARKLSISGHPGSYTVHLDDQDMSHALRGVHLDVGPSDEFPKAILDVIVWNVGVEDLDAEVVIPEPTRDLLVRLGWTPPGEQPKPTVHIENYVAGSPEDIAAELKFLGKRP